LHLERQSRMRHHHRKGPPVGPSSSSLSISQGSHMSCKCNANFCKVGLFLESGTAPTGRYREYIRKQFTCTRAKIHRRPSSLGRGRGGGEILSAADDTNLHAEQTDTARARRRPPGLTIRFAERIPVLALAPTERDFGLATRRISSRADLVVTAAAALHCRVTPGQQALAAAPEGKKERENN
jgi:hypothetical protein